MSAPVENVWFVYDGQCPLCLMGATHFRIRQAVGNLNLLDAREYSNHPIMHEVNSRGLNLDDGMAIKLGDMFYHGAEALHIMAMLGSNSEWLNRINTSLFKSKRLSNLLYPSFRGTRNLMLAIKGIGKIDNLHHSRAK